MSTHEKCALVLILRWLLVGSAIAKSLVLSHLATELSLVVTDWGQSITCTVLLLYSLVEREKENT